MKDVLINPTRLLVEDIIEQDSVTKGGIILSSVVVKTPTTRGTVLAVGCGTPEVKIPYSIGDTVLYLPHAGTKLNYEGKELRLLDVGDILLGGA